MGDPGPLVHVRVAPPGPAPRGYRLVVALLRTGMRLMRWRLDVDGLDNVPPRGGAVITFNHNAHLDLVVVVPLLVYRGRWVRLLALRELWSSPTMGVVVRIAHCLPVDRAHPARREGAFRDAVAAARGGELVMVAPEGSISPSGELQAFQGGAARIARAAGVPIVPTASWGAQRFSTTGRGPSLRRAWRLPVAMRVGRPMAVGPSADLAAVTARLEEATAALLAEMRSRDPRSPGGDGGAPRR